MFSFQSNWKLSAGILSRDERHKIAASARVIADKKGKLVSLQNTNLIDIYFQILSLETYLTRLFQKRTRSVFSFLAECQHLIMARYQCQNFVCLNVLNLYWY